MAEADDYEQSLKCMDDKCKARIRTPERTIDLVVNQLQSPDKSAGVTRPKASIAPGTNVTDCEDTSSTTMECDSDLSEALLPPSKSKVVRIDPEPTVMEFQCREWISPVLPSNIRAKKYKWTNCYFREPTKSAMKKRTTSQLPKDSSVLPHAPISPVPSRMLPPSSPAEKPVNSSTLPLMPSSAVPSTQPNIKDVLATSATSKIPLSSSSRSAYALPKDSASTCLPVSPRDSTGLPPILPKSCSTMVPPISPSKTPPRSSQNHLKKSSTCPTKSERLLPPIPLECSNKEPKRQRSSSGISQLKGCSGSVKLKNSSKMLPIPLRTMPQKCYKVAPLKDSGTILANSSSKVLAMSLKDHSKLPLKTPNRMLLPPPIRPPASPEKPRKETIRKVISTPVNIAKENPEKLLECIRVQIDDVRNAVPVVYHEHYNLILPPSTMYLFHLMVPDKPAKIYAILQSECLKEYRCVKWTGADVSTVYNIDDYVPDFTTIAEFNTKWICMLHQLYMETSVTSPIKLNTDILQPLRVQTMGSVVACELALNEGWAINIGGGFSHYTANNTIGALHIYNDVLLCLAIMSKSPKVDKILVINVDAFECLSYTFKTFTSSTISCPVDVIDIYSQKNIWRHRINVDLPHCFTSEVDHDELSQELPADVDYIGHRLTRKGPGHYDQCISKFQMEMDRLYKDTPCLVPSLCIYVAGSYSLKEHTDSAVMSLSQEEIVKRDQAVFELIRKVYKIPIVILLGGGYRPWDVDAAAASVCNLCQIGIPLLGQR